MLEIVEPPEEPRLYPLKVRELLDDLNGLIAAVPEAADAQIVVNVVGTLWDTLNNLTYDLSRHHIELTAVRR